MVLSTEEIPLAGLRYKAEKLHVLWAISLKHSHSLQFAKGPLTLRPPTGHFTHGAQHSGWQEGNGSRHAGTELPLHTSTHWRGRQARTVGGMGDRTVKGTDGFVSDHARLLRASSLRVAASISSSGRASSAGTQSSSRRCPC